MKRRRLAEILASPVVADRRAGLPAGKASDRAGLPDGKAGNVDQAGEITTRFRAVMAAYVDDADRIDLTRPFHALGMDSIDVLDLTMDVEDDFHVTSPDHVEQGWNNPADALAWLIKELDR